jgi:hypothetical protein
VKSLLNYCQKIRDGVLFAETFENDNFVAAQGWVALQGVARNTGQQAKVGIRSLLLAGMSTPILWKASTDADVENPVAEVWFYDTMDAVLPGPFFKIKLSDGKFFQMGVRNSVSTVNYCANASGVYTEDNFVDSTKARSLGWHRFRIQRVGTAVSMAVDADGLGAFTWTAAAGSYVTDLKLQADVYGSTAEGFGYFDEVRLYRHNAVKVSGVAGRVVNFRDATEGMFPVTLDLATDTTEYTTSPYVAVPFPVQYSLQISQRISSAGDTSAYAYLAHRTPTLDLNLGDWYQFAEIDFGTRRVTTFDLTPRTLTNKNESANGHAEVLTYGWKDRLGFTVSALEGRDYWEQAQNWYEYARLGQPFGLLVQENDHAFHKVRTLARAGSTTLNLYLNITGGGGNVTAGRTVVIQKADRSARQVVEVTTVTPNASGPILTLASPLRFDAEVYDIVRSLYFFYALEMEGQDLGLNMSNPRRERFNWVQTVREYVP